MCTGRQGSWLHPDWGHTTLSVLVSHGGPIFVGTPGAPLKYVAMPSDARGCHMNSILFGDTMVPNIE